MLCHRIFLPKVRRTIPSPQLWRADASCLQPGKKWRVTFGACVCIYGAKLSADPFLDISSPLILILPYLFAVGGKEHRARRCRRRCRGSPRRVRRSPIATPQGPASDAAWLVGLARRFCLHCVPPHRCHRATVSRLSFRGHTISYAGTCICTSPNRKVFLGS
jgi:hypothetical protein